MVEPPDKVAVPAVSVPDVDKASLPKSIASEDEVIDPLEIVTSPISDPDDKVDTPAVRVPLVKILSFPKDMFSVPDAMTISKS